MSKVLMFMFGIKFGLVGTIVIALGVAALIAKNKPAGRAWFEKFFGKNWEKSTIAKFFGIPMIIVGLLLYIPDPFYWNIWEAMGMFIVYFLWDKKQAKKKTTTETKTGDATA